MRLNESLLERAEEFFDLVANEQENIDLDSAMDSLRRFLEEDIDGWTHRTEEDLAYTVQDKLEEIWNLIPDHEKQDNFLLEDHYDDMMSDMECITGETEDAFWGNEIEEDACDETGSDSCFEDED